MADDAINRGLTPEEANPFLGVNTLNYLGDEVRTDTELPDYALTRYSSLRMVANNSSTRCLQGVSDRAISKVH